MRFKRKTFSLQTLFLITAVAAMAVAVVAADYRASLEAKACRKLVESIGGTCVTNSKGLLFVGRITEVDLRRGIVTAYMDEPRHWGFLPNVDGSSTRIEATMLSAIGRTKTINALNVSGAELMNDNLAELAPLRQLAALDLSGTKIDDRGLKHLLQFRSLRELNLSATAITDVGLKTVTAHENLRVLKLDFCSITDAAVPLLAAMRGLNHLICATR